MNRLLVITAALLTAAGARANPAAAMQAAVADARLQKAEARYTRYLWLGHLTPGEARGLYLRVLALHVNALSREPKIVPPRPVYAATPDPPREGVVQQPIMLAVDGRAYGWDLTVWERMADREPYFHRRTFTVKPFTANPSYDAQGRLVPGKTTETRAEVVAPGTWLDPREVDELYALTGSRVPVVFGDWFFAQTCVSADRGGELNGKYVGGGFGYYEWLGIRSRDDYFKLLGFDPKAHRSAVSELNAVVKGGGSPRARAAGRRSGVAQNDRFVVRMDAIGGPAWFTLDTFDNNRDERNALQFLDHSAGFKHQAEEHFGRLPNGLAVVIACTDKGELQATAPDKIGPDKTATGNDARIHSAKSCFSCHDNGYLKDFDDEVRAISRKNPGQYGNTLKSPDDAERRLLERRFRDEMDQALTDDRAVYERQVKKASGTESRVASAEYREAYERYVDDDVTRDVVAVHLGVSRQDFDAKLSTYREADRYAAPILAALSAGRPVTRTDEELIYPLLAEVVRGKYVPVARPQGGVP